MSTDDYYVIQKHPYGGFAAVHGFDSVGGQPQARPDHRQFPTAAGAAEYARSRNPERGVYYGDSLAHTAQDDWRNVGDVWVRPSQVVAVYEDDSGAVLAVLHNATTLRVGDSRDLNTDDVVGLLFGDDA